jgi:hypothetical protein
VKNFPPMFPTNPDWECHVCGEMRPDAAISTVQYSFRQHFVKVTYSIRYCNDRQSCEDGTLAVAQSWAESLRTSRKREAT